MRLQQIKYGDSTDIGCSLYFALDVESEFDDYTIFDAEIDLFGPDPSSNIIIESMTNCIVSPSILSDNQDIRQVQILIFDEDHNLQFRVRSKSEDTFKSIVFELPNIKVIRAILEFLEKGLTENRVILLEKEYDYNREYKALLRLIDDAKRCLPFSDYTRLLDEVARWNREIQRKIDDFESRHTFFRDMILGLNQGKYYRIKSQADLRDRIDLYESRDSLGDIHVEYVLKLCLKRLDEEGGREDLIEFVNQMQVTNEYADILRDYQVDLILADAAIERNRGRAQTIVLNCIPEPVENYNYKDIKEKAKNEEEYVEKVKLWFDLLRQAIDESPNELDFVLANYLYWKAELLRSNSEKVDLIQHFYHGSSVLFKHIDMNGYAQRAKYNFYLRRGFRYQNKNELEHAISNFKQAIRVAANETNEWETIFRDDILIAAEYETRAEYRVLMEDDDLDGAIKLLNDRIETIQDVEIQDSIDKEVILDRLRADIQKIKADQNIQRQQYRLAIENIEECIKIYSRT